jgi:hypothetical protein
MATSGSMEPSGPLYATLGLPEQAPASEIARVYARLRTHIEARVLAAADPESRARHVAELEALVDAFEGPGGRDTGASPAGSDSQPSPLRSWLGRAGWALAGAGLLALALLVASRFGGEAPPPVPASIAIHGDPADARVDLLASQDEQVVASGRADGSPLQAPEGHYTLRVTHPDCPETWSQQVTLSSGDFREYAPRLCQGEGELVIRSNVSEDRALVDGLDVGQTGSDVHALRVGSHTVEVRKQGFHPWSSSACGSGLGIT